MPASFFLGINTGIPSATPTHCTAAVLRMEEEERVGEELGWELELERGRSGLEGAGNVKGNKMSGNQKDTENR